MKCFHKHTSSLPVPFFHCQSCLAPRLWSGTSPGLVVYSLALWVEIWTGSAVPGICWTPLFQSWIDKKTNMNTTQLTLAQKPCTSSIAHQLASHFSTMCCSSTYSVPGVPDSENLAGDFSGLSCDVSNMRYRDWDCGTSRSCANIIHTKSLSQAL